MATSIKELEDDVERKRTAESLLRSEYQRAKMNAEGLRAEGGKLIRMPKDKSPEMTRRLTGDRAALARATKARKAAEARLDEATLQRHASGGKPAPVYGPTGARFFADLVTAAERGPTSDAARRLERHARQLGEARASGLVQGAGFLVPNYYASAWADVPRTAAPVFSAIPKLPLPAFGFDAYVPAWTTGAEADVQTKTAGVNDDLPQADAIPVASEQVTAHLATVALDWDVNRQVLERARPGWDVAFGRDAAAAIYERLDDLLINADGTGQTPIGLLNVPSALAHDASGAADAQAQLRALAEAASEQYAVRHALPECLLASPARAMSWLSGSTTAGAPLLPQGALPTPGLGSNPEWPVAMILPGVRLIVSDKIADDTAVLWRASDAMVAVDDNPLQFVYEQQGSSALRVHLISYLLVQAFLHRVPSSIMIVGNLPAITW
jgi:hypothetical protein